MRPIRSTLAIALLTTQLAIPAGAGLFGSKITSEYRRLAAAAEKLAKSGKADDHLKQLNAAHEVIKKEPSSRYFDESLINLGKFHARRGLWWNAEPYLRQAVESATGKHGTNHLSTARAMFIHAQSLMHLYQFEEAAREMTMAEYTARWKTGRYSVTVGYCKAVLGQLLVLTGKPAEAIPILEDSLRQMGRLRSFTSVSAVTSGVINNSLSLPGSSTDVYRPDPEDVVTLLVDYAVALRGVGREAEAEEALAGARTTLSGKLRYPMPDFFIKRRISEAHEAAGNLSLAEKYIYEAVNAAYQSPIATPREKRAANFSALGFHVRQGQNSQASIQEGILIQNGLTLDDLDPFNTRQMRLREERLKARDRQMKASAPPAGSDKR
jgi:tetratricopeptide (TPR) repeat protein